MKIAAHPLVVAVALGLLGPNALAEEIEGSTEQVRCDTCDGSCATACEPLPEPAALGADAIGDDNPLRLAVEDVWADMVSTTVDLT